MAPSVVQRGATPAATSATTRVFDLEEIRKHNSEKDAWVTLEGEVFDVTRFIKDHPGGKEVVLDYLGTDITNVFFSDDIHAHSENAQGMLAQYRIGTVTGAKAKSSSSTDTVGLDLSKPLVMQVHKLGQNYSDYIHKAQVLPEPARFFENPVLEFLSRTPWYVVPLFWMPVIALMEYYSTILGLTPVEAFCHYIFGVVFWTVLEYTLHRFLFHLDHRVQFSPIAITAHFLLHGCHHLLPMDKMRLVFPPAAAAIIATPVFFFFRIFFDHTHAISVLGGGIQGYVFYDMMHYYLHHAKPWGSYLQELKTYHLNHHYKNHNLGYGISSKFWDHVFGTVLT
eukprot:JP446362.1.p2 GENE.JP446362.1~~JP446362.1.p2  ORF type:complete len:346 (-),score=111.22 JP446362.1:132-1145(-)